MNRVLQTLALALLVLGLGGRAAMAGKPSVVILGLEIIDKGGGMDQATVQLAKDFTTALRARASQAGQLVAHSDKELVDEKLIRNCTNADASCIAPIGAEFGATYLIYGSVEKSPTGSKVSLHLLNVASKQLVKHFPTDLKDVSPTGLTEAARAAYAGLLGGDSASLNINIQNDGVDGGTVTIGKDKHDLKGGHLTVKDLGPDRYSMTIDVTGFQRFEQTVSVGQGEKKEVVVTLVPLPGSKIVTPPRCSDGSLDCQNTVSHTNNHTGYKVAGYGALILAAAAGGFALYENHVVGTYEGSTTPPPNPNHLVPADGKQFGDKDCSAAKGKIGSTDFDNACDANSKIVPAAVIGGVAAGVAVVALILAYRGSDDQPEKHAQQTGRRKTPKPLIAITPIVSPDGGGATVRIDF